MTGGESLNIKGSTISHMAAVHPGHQLPGVLQKEEEEEEKEEEEEEEEGERSLPKVRTVWATVLSRERY